MRNYVPKVKTLAELKKEGYEEDKKGYDRSVAELKEYAGKGKTSPGNIYEVSDFFLEKRKDIMVHKIVFYTPGTMPKETEEKRSADKDRRRRGRVIGKKIHVKWGLPYDDT
ncbi:MAG: hypothetical protein K6E34_07640 [Lachnospiraceae bacterium]|nr:hypothetical protein [Lachnospiraceae bacterium]